MEAGWRIRASSLVPPVARVRRTLSGWLVHAMRRSLGSVSPELATRVVGGMSLLAIADWKGADR